MTNSPEHYETQALESLVVGELKEAHVYAMLAVAAAAQENSRVVEFYAKEARS